MTNCKEIIRLHANGFSMRSIAQALGCHRTTIRIYLGKSGKQQLYNPSKRI